MDLMKISSAAAPSEKEQNAAPSGAPCTGLPGGVLCFYQFLGPVGLGALGGDILPKGSAKGHVYQLKPPADSQREGGVYKTNDTYVKVIVRAGGVPVLLPIATRLEDCARLASMQAAARGKAHRVVGFGAAFGLLAVPVGLGTGLPGGVLCFCQFLADRLKGEETVFPRGFVPGLGLVNQLHLFLFPQHRQLCCIRPSRFGGS